MLKFSPHHFKAMICTGGIGSGSLFLLNGNHNLGREESRGGKYLDARDYCKMHIIAHNVKKLSDPGFHVYAIGKVGNDATGRDILREMKEAEIDLTYVGISPGDRTLFAFCFLYPDGTGGNLTADESACSKVGEADILAAEEIFRRNEGRFIALAAPEVPLTARQALLRLSQKYGGFSVASFTAGEMREVEKLDMLSMIQLLAVNIDEAAMLAGVDINRNEPLPIIEKLIARIKKSNPQMCLSVTAGKTGSWTWDGGALNFVPALSLDVKSSAGAGDAHISGIISGLNAGLDLSQAQQLGNLAGALAVTSQHTIHPEMGRRKIAELIHGQPGAYADNVLRFISGSS
ncbi:MAG: hypothetical protein JNK79_18675 [Chitinophagaceae bacterium]|nr:hypothetical protein [Chitinophagaceae bacterium]